MTAHRTRSKHFAASLPFLASAAMLIAFGCEDPTFESCGDIVCAQGTHCTASKDGCTASSCGNRIVETSEGEICDDGNLKSGDGCSANCKSEEKCGNGIPDTSVGELCDDGNTSSGDGCSADCRSTEICGNKILDS